MAISQPLPPSREQVDHAVSVLGEELAQRIVHGTVDEASSLALWELCAAAEHRERPVCPPRFYVAAGGFAWHVYDRSNGHRVGYFRARDHGGWPEAGDAARAACERWNDHPELVETEGEDALRARG